VGRRRNGLRSDLKTNRSRPLILPFSGIPPLIFNSEIPLRGRYASGWIGFIWVALGWKI